MARTHIECAIQANCSYLDIHHLGRNKFGERSYAERHGDFNIPNKRLRNDLGLTQGFLGKKSGSHANGKVKIISWVVPLSRKNPQIMKQMYEVQEPLATCIHIGIGHMHLQEIPRLVYLPTFIILSLCFCPGLAFIKYTHANNFGCRTRTLKQALALLI